MLEDLIGDPPPPPPQDAGVLPADDKPTAGLTFRQVLEQHRRKPECAGCHAKIDPIGFGLENFDPIGRWRETERVGNKDLPIETNVVLPSGARYATVQELKALLGSQQHRLARELLESLLGYGLGRTVEFSDAIAVEEMLGELEPHQFPVRSMVHAIVSSELFQTR